MKETDLAYIAGLFDGEGCILINKRTSGIDKNHIQHSLSCQVVITYPEIVEKLQEYFGGSVQPHPLGIKHYGNKPLWKWSIQTMQAASFLQLILPYLRIKKKQAELALAFQDRLTHRNKPILPEELVKRENIRCELMGSRV